MCRTRCILVPYHQSHGQGWRCLPPHDSPQLSKWHNDTPQKANSSWMYDARLSDRHGGRREQKGVYSVLNGGGPEGYLWNMAAFFLYECCFPRAMLFNSFAELQYHNQRTRLSFSFTRVNRELAQEALYQFRFPWTHPHENLGLTKHGTVLTIISRILQILTFASRS